MITYQSFLNPGVDEGQSIGRLFYDRDEQPHSSTKYLELVQAEDYILFRIVHESKEQRYGYDQYRHIFESRIPATDGHALADFLLTEVGETGDYPTQKFYSDYDEDLIITLTEAGATFGGNHGGYIIKVRLDADDTATVRVMVQDMNDAYTEMLNDQVPVTASVADFRHAAVRLDNYLSRKIYEHTDWRGYDDGYVLTIQFANEYEASEVEAAFNAEIGWTVEEWHGILAVLDEEREHDLCRLLVEKLGFSRGELPYGETFRVMHWIEVPHEYDERITDALIKSELAHPAR